MGVGVRIKLELCLKISPPLHAKRTAHAKRCMESRIHELCGYPPHHCTNHPRIPFSGAVNTSIYTVGISPTAVLIARERCLVGPLTRVYIRQFEGFQHTIYTRVISPTAVLITRKFHLVGPLTRVYIVCWNRREKVRTFIFASIMIDQLMKQFLTYVSRFEGRLRRISPT